MKVKDYSYETFPRYTVNIDGALELKGNKEHGLTSHKSWGPHHDRGRWFQFIAP